MATRTTTRRSAKSSTGWTDAEKAAMRERAREMKAEARLSKDRAAGESELLAAIAKMPAPDRSMGKRIHEIVTANVPGLMPRTWYGMPAYANADGKVVCFFQAASKFKVRYASFGFNDAASLDDGNMWPTSFALTKLTASEESRIATLVKKSVK